MRPVDVARALPDAGLPWTPARGDSFVMPGRDTDSDVFVVGDGYRLTLRSRA